MELIIIIIIRKCNTHEVNVHLGSNLAVASMDAHARYIYSRFLSISSTWPLLGKGSHPK